jgi:hypothetical protein
MIEVTREQWVAALRSGDFKQAKGELYDDKVQGYCCLGVLGELAGGVKDPMQCGGMTFEVEFSSGYIPSELGGMVGITVTDQRKLAGLNDSGRYTFDEIADFVETMEFATDPKIGSYFEFNED